jgi:hypothetical protein
VAARALAALRAALARGRWRVYAARQRVAIDHIADAGYLVSMSSAAIDFGDYGSADVTIIPTVLIGPARASLQAQGTDPMIIKDDGSLDYERLIGTAFDTVEIRTTVTPPWRIDLRPGEPPPEGAPPQLPMVAQLKPSVILSGRFGRAVIAPYGLPEGSTAIANGLKAAAAVIAAIIVWKVF